MNADTMPLAVNWRRGKATDAFSPGFFLGASNPLMPRALPAYSDEDMATPDLGQSVPGGTGSYASALSPSPGGPSLEGTSEYRDYADVGNRLRQALQPNQISTPRALVGALFAHRSPMLASVVTGDYQRQKQIQPLEQQFGLLGNIIAQNRAMQKSNLDTQNIQSEIAERGARADYWNRMANAKENVLDKSIREGFDADGNAVTLFQRPDNTTYTVKTQGMVRKPNAEAPHTTDFGEFHWQYDPDRNLSGPREGDWVRLGPSNRQGREPGDETPAQRLARTRLRNQYERDKSEGLRRAEDDIRKRYGLTGFAASEPWPPEAIDELESSKQRVQDEYESKLGNLGVDTSHFDYRSQRNAGGGNQSGAGALSKALDRNNPDDRRIATQILQEAGGDVNKARQIAKQRGYKF